MLALGLSLGLLAATPDVFVDASRAKTLVDAGALVLDARSDKDQSPGIPGAVRVDWMDYRQGRLRDGRLSADLEGLREKLAALGVRNDRPTLVYGSMKDGWGEEARIWWMLRYLGLRQTFILDGGLLSYRAAGHTTGPPEKPKRSAPGKLKLSPEPSLRADRSRVDEARKRGKTVLLDTRRRSEFDGETPYFSSRGGHVPGAKHAWWKDVIAPDGRLRSKTWIRNHFQTLGVAKSTPVITYCTGGVRSTFIQAALLHAGITNVQNYDGSWWDWSSDEQLPVER